MSTDTMISVAVVAISPLLAVVLAFAFGRSQRKVNRLRADLHSKGLTGRRATVVEVEDFGVSLGEFRYRYQVWANKDFIDEFVSLTDMTLVEGESEHGTLLFIGTGETDAMALDMALSALAYTRPSSVRIIFKTNE